MSDRFYFRVIGVFIILNGALLLSKAWLLDKGAHHNVLLFGNLALATISGITYNMSRKGVQSENNSIFMLRVYGSMISRMMLCLAGITIYAVANRANTSRITIFILMFFYMVYAICENISLQKITRKKN
jgi:ABC-type multidrug transport system permease subunit